MSRHVIKLSCVVDGGAIDRADIWNDVMNTLLATFSGGMWGEGGGGQIFFIQHDPPFSER